MYNFRLYSHLPCLIDLNQSLKSSWSLQKSYGKCAMQVEFTTKRPEIKLLSDLALWALNRAV